MNNRNLSREERTARIAELRAREAARKVWLTGGPLMEQPLVDRLAFALFDPGAIVPRNHGYSEPMHRWQARAAQYVIPTTTPAEEQLRAELSEYEQMSPQQCPKGEHADWLVDSEYAHACPWCRIAELEAGGDRV
ncbi:hypothetical protein [Streptomyces fagopyri]|uniref:hypothetical protein n=1 Tax=Streptomyces fagopyri TaxID=2662397 RepID=UPI0037FDC8CC